MNIPRKIRLAASPGFVTCSIIAVLLCATPAGILNAKKLHVEISPDMIRQGDAFVIRVRGVNSRSVPTATIGKHAIPFSRCGEECYLGIGAVELNARPGAQWVRIKVGNMNRRLRLTVKRGSFQTTALTLPEEKVLLSPADLEIVKKEQHLLRSLFLSVSDKLWEGNFLIPLDNAITTPFGEKRVMNEAWTSIHRGVDIKAEEGEGVRASNSGTVVYAQELFFGGNSIILDHGQGIHTVYMHLSSMKVKPGDSVSKGAVIGLAGSTGRSTGPHLHFGVKVGVISVNPLSVMGLDL